VKTLLEIDETNRSEYSFLDPSDRCFYYREFHLSEDKYDGSINSLINNLKKPMSRKDKKDWFYKGQAISNFANILRSLRAWEELKSWTWIPIPPSAPKSDNDYDDRLVQVLENLKKGYADFVFKELIEISGARQAAHSTESQRPSPDDHLRNFKVNERLKNPAPENGIVIFDDVITTGSGFKAMQKLITDTYKNVQIIGLFLARTIHAPDDPINDFNDSH